MAEQKVKRSCHRSAGLPTSRFRVISEAKVNPYLIQRTLLSLRYQYPSSYVPLPTLKPGLLPLNCCLNKRGSLAKRSENASLQLNRYCPGPGTREQNGEISVSPSGKSPCFKATASCHKIKSKLLTWTRCPRSASVSITVTSSGPRLLSSHCSVLLSFE